MEELRGRGINGLKLGVIAATAVVGAHLVVVAGITTRRVVILTMDMSIDIIIVVFVSS